MPSSGTSDTRGAVGVEEGSVGGVDIGWTDARGACEFWGHTELRTHEIPGSLFSSVKRTHGICQKDKKREKEIRTAYGL